MMRGMLSRGLVSFGQKPVANASSSSLYAFSRGMGSISTNCDVDLNKIRRFKPITPGVRHKVAIDRSELWKGRPIKELTYGMRKSGGRNHSGQITVRHRGGGHRRRYRLLDFERRVVDQPAVVQRFEYDPNRSAHLALLKYPDSGMLSYIIRPQGMKVGDSIIASREREVEIKIGNAMPLNLMPVGTPIHNMELRPGRGAQLARSAGCYAELLSKTSRPGYALVRMASKEHRYVDINCMATIGAVSNPMHKLIKLGKAGASRWRGRRPTVRGVAMNPVDHPHGGREGKGRPGRPSCSPTGVLAKGFKTVKKKNPLIVVARGGVRKANRKG